MQKGKWTQYDKQKLHAVFIKWGDVFMNNEEAWGCICNDRKYRLWYIGMRPVNLHYNPTSNFNILNINPADLVFPHLNKCDDIQLQELFCWHIVKDFTRLVLWILTLADLSCGNSIAKLTTRCLSLMSP